LGHKRKSGQTKLNPMRTGPGVNQDILLLPSSGTRSDSKSMLDKFATDVGEESQFRRRHDSKNPGILSKLRKKRERPRGRRRTEKIRGRKKTHYHGCA